MRRIAALFAEALDHVDDEEALDRIAGQVREMVRAYPAPGITDRITVGA